MKIGLQCVAFPRSQQIVIGQTKVVAQSSWKIEKRTMPHLDEYLSVTTYKLVSNVSVEASCKMIFMHDFRPVAMTLFSMFVFVISNFESGRGRTLRERPKVGTIFEKSGWELIVSPK
jgi:hypothetical protein